VQSGLLVTVPVPREAEVPQEILDEILNESLRDAEVSKITGRDLTPFLLARMAERSDGATLRANIALLENNARVAAYFARAHSPIPLRE
jgi:pseudouridine-5'-phosphate glycosidase